MLILFYVAVFLVCLYAVIRSGAVLVKSLVQIAQYLNMSEYTVAFILMAFATSVPELFVGITSAFANKAQLALGNVIGANIINPTLGLGLVIMAARGIKVNNEVLKKDAWIIFFLAILPILLILDNHLSRLDGFILLLFFFWYITRLLGRKEELAKKITPLKNNINQLKSFFRSILYFILGLVVLLLAAWGSVWSASQIASTIGISLLSIGLILVALGTTLPEISFGLRSVILKHEDMTIGNFFGSIAFNALFVLGLVAVIQPFTLADVTIIKIGGLILAIALLVINLFIRTKNYLSYKEGFVLLAIYFFFLLVETLLS